MKVKSVSLVLIAVFALSACFPAAPALTRAMALDAPNALPLEGGQPVAAVTATPSPEPPGPGDPMGPNPGDFPAGYNPLTGELVDDPNDLNLPAILMSLSNFPPSVRPQTGLSFAPQVYEIYITVGMTRFLTVFYGNYPKVNLPVLGDQSPLEGPAQVEGTLIADWVWLDSDKDGLQDFGEPGVGGVEVILRDEGGKELARTITNASGYYAFGAESGKQYLVEFVKPSKFSFTQKDKGGSDEVDSDADPASGRTAVFSLGADTRDWDAGLTANQSEAEVTETPGPTPEGPVVTEESPLIPAPDDEISGVRSGRQAYAPILASFSFGCLIAGSKAPNVKINICQNVFEKDPNNINSAGMSIDKIKELAAGNKNPNKELNYSGNVFDPNPPAGGVDGRLLNVFYSQLNQSQWVYDPAGGAYMRFEDYGREDMIGQFKMSTDRLTQQPLYFENVVVIFVEHEVVAPTILDLDMIGGREKAVVFRDGKVYENLRWSMRNGDYERQTGMMRPVRIEYPDGTPFPLAPGHTWFLVATPYSRVWQVAAGQWNYRFVPPKGAK